MQDDPTPFSVIIPAHNEEAVIGRCLRAILRDAPSLYPYQLIVAANGCSDKTAQRASRIAPEAIVLNLPEASKTLAINAANSRADYCPRIFLDADVECSFSSLRALAETVGQPGAMVAAPQIQLDCGNCSWIMRAYLRVWSKLPYATSGNGGAGCYALSRAALEQIGEFPPIIGDDIWVHGRFPPEQKRYVVQDRLGKPVFSTVYPPRIAREQIRVEARKQAGNIEVLQSQSSPHAIERGGANALQSAIKAGADWPDISVYFSVKIVARIVARWNQYRGKPIAWSRDLSSRQAEQ